MARIAGTDPEAGALLLHGHLDVVPPGSSASSAPVIAGYGFTPLRLPPGFDYYARFHGVDEQIPVSAIHFAVRVMTRFLAAA